MSETHNSITVKQLCEELWEFEKKNKLLEFEIQGIYVWQLIRFKVFSKLSRKKGLYGKAHSSVDSFRDRLRTVPSLLLNSVLRSPMKGSYNKDFLIYDHPRKINVNNKMIDIYTQSFIEKLPRESFEVIESPYLSKHTPSFNHPFRKYNDHQKLTVLIKRQLLPMKLEANEKQRIKDFERKIREFFGIKSIDIYPWVIKLLNNFKHEYNYHKRLLKKRKPKSVYVVVSYNYMPIIAAAKDLEIEVVEFQHGIINDYHFAYNFSDPKKNLKYFPDRLLTFGEYWAKTEKFPQQTEIEIYGFPYLNRQFEKYKYVSKKKNQVLLLSQGTIGKELSILAKELAELMPSHHFIFKLHPGEYNRWISEYPALVEASNLDNFEVIDHNKKSLYSYLAESEFQVGVYSTAIFEGLILDCKTILFNIQGIEYMKDLVDLNLVLTANDKNEFVYHIKDFKASEVDKENFFKGVYN